MNLSFSARRNSHALNARLHGKQAKRQIAQGILEFVVSLEGLMFVCLEGTVSCLLKSWE
jgi:hypothetical protein